jgi:hypothetical protein
MTFQPGQSGNPAGRAVGSRNKKTLAVEAALFEHAQELVDDLVARAKRGEPAAMRLAMERILPAGRGRPLPIELPPVRSGEDAYAAAGVIMDALKEGALSAREAVDLLAVVAGLTRLTGAVEYIKRVARREVARAAQTLGFEHFFAGRPADNNYARQVAELNADEEEETAEEHEDELPRHPDEYRSTQDPLYRWNREDMEAHAASADTAEGAAEGDEGLQIVADSEGEPPPTPDPSPPLASLAGGGEPRGP